MNYRLLAMKHKPEALHDKEFREQLLTSVRLADSANQVEYSTALSLHESMAQTAGKLYGTSSSEYRYIRSHKPERPASNMTAYNRLLKKYQQWWIDEQRREKDRQRRKELPERREQAIEELTGAGFQPGIDFEESKAISTRKSLVRTAWDLCSDWWWMEQGYYIRAVGGRTLYEQATPSRSRRYVRLERIEPQDGNTVSVVSRYVHPDMELELVKAQEAVQP